MSKYTFAKSPFIIALSLLSFFCPLRAADSVTVIAASGSIGDFKGFGCNLTSFSGNLSNANKQTISNIIWKDLNLQICRFYRSLQRLTPADELSEFQSALSFVKIAQPNIKVLYNPTGVINGNAASWATSIATHIKYFKDQGVSCEATGIGNEPNQDTSRTSNDWAARMPATLNTTVIKLLRTELNSRGLNSVKIIANESSNVDQYVWTFANAITADASALTAFDYFAYHSYNMSMTNALYAYLKPLNKGGFWQTETCSYGGLTSEGLSDSGIASETATKFLCDMNFNTTYWAYWIDKSVGTTSDNSSRLLGYNSSTGAYVLPLKYYYIKLLSQQFVPGSLFRKSTTNLGARTGRVQDTYMEYTYGLKVPIASATAMRPDSHWVIAVSNHTGLPPGTVNTTYYPKNSYNVTFDIEELRGIAQTNFNVWRCSNGKRIVMDAAEITMIAGKCKITVAPFELICLVSKNALVPSSTPTSLIGHTSHREKTARIQKPIVYFSGKNTPQLRLLVSGKSANNLYDIQGRIIPVHSSGKSLNTIGTRILISH